MASPVLDRPILTALKESAAVASSQTVELPDGGIPDVDLEDAAVEDVVEEAANVDHTVDHAGGQEVPDWDAGGSKEQAWCPAGVETLPGPICAVVPDAVGQDIAPTLVIFLHGITNVGSGWQIPLIQGMAQYAEHQRFALLAPRAPLQPSVKGEPAIYAWRTSTLSPDAEAAMLDSWMAAKAALEQRSGHQFKQVFVMGFSSGAYYVSSLALRGRLPVEGYAAFAGGSAPFSRSMISKVKPRIPIFVGYGSRDRAGSRDARSLATALRKVRWPHRVMAVGRAGHTITTKQFASALAYLRSTSAAGTSSTWLPPTQSRGGSKHRVRPRRWDVQPSVQNQCCE